ncbi:MAG: hypothetical protein DRP02_14600 [Candidatus Gerdarchaeota archaeon]|nr:MAG: hypothetical protein DRP02_14600 [Candidatus Gerdarchaeota archaeon]
MTEKISNVGAAASGPGIAAAPGPELAPVIVKLQEIKAQLNNEQAVYYIDCAIATLSKKDLRELQKQTMIDYLEQLEQEGLLNLGYKKTYCARCSKLMRLDRPAFFYSDIGIICEQCHKDLELLQEVLKK